MASPRATGVSHNPETSAHGTVAFADSETRSHVRRPSPMRLKSQEHVSDPERTPRLHDLPKIISTLPTPRRLPHGDVDSVTSAEDNDYFLLQTSTMHSAGTTESETPLSLATQPSSSPLSPHVSARSANHHDKSPLQPCSSSRSVQSEASSRADPSAVRSAPAPIQTRPPPYPNQSYAALQNQPNNGLFTPQSAPNAGRSWTLHPVTGNTASDVPITAPFAYPSHSRTNGNIPTPIPGLFENTAAHTPATPDTALPFSYLNTLQHRQPKETSIADIDVDPVSGRKIINDYEIIGELGRGVQGKVKLGRSLQTGQHVAIKIVDRYPKKKRLGKSGKADDNVKREVAILKKARHPNIVALLEVIDDPARKKVYIILERVDLGEINWRADPTYAREIALIEYRRFERESRGIIDDPATDQEDQAILELARVRRAKAARARFRTLRRQDTGAWSIETAGGIYDDSDFDDISHDSTSNDSLAEASGAASPTLSQRSSNSAASYAKSIASPSPKLTRQSSLKTQGLSKSPSQSSNHNAGTVAGHYSDQSSKKDVGLGSNATDTSDPGAQPSDEDHDLDSPHAQSDNNLMQRAIAITAETEMLPDLQYVPTMSFAAARHAFRDTLLGLQYLHYHGVIHRDIKPPNLLQTRDLRIKISDFGVSYLGRPTHEQKDDKQSESDVHEFDEAKELAKTVGTAAFYAPELCYTDSPDDQPPVGKAIDVWALGVTLYCMLFARVPIAEASEYVAMRRITDEKIHIPTKRLVPIGPQTSSYDIIHPPTPGTRNPSALIYEELDEALLDLLRRLLTKKPQDRISLEEVRHHPWVVADITEKERWLDETDPVVQAQGKKIVVTTEDVERSVQPINLINRVRLGIKKAVAVGFGLARSNSARKKDAASLAAGLAQNATTPNTPISAIGSPILDFRKVPIRTDDTIVSALKASRDSDHPLNQSMSTTKLDPSITENLAQPAGIIPDEPLTPLMDQHLRTVDAEDVGASSARTIRPTNAGLESFRESRSGSPSPAHSLDSPGGAPLSGMLSGATRLLKSVRGRSRQGRASLSRDPSSSRASISDTSDARATASLAVSTALAAGEIDGPDALKDTSTPSTSASHSLSTSPAMPSIHSFIGSSAGRHHGERATYSRQSSLSSVDHLDRGRAAIQNHSRSSSLLRNMSEEEDLDDNEEDPLSRRLAELHASQPPPNLSRRSSAAVGTGTDHSSSHAVSSAASDEIALHHNQDQTTKRSSSSVAPSAMPSLEASPVSGMSSTLPLITPSASVDGMALGLSPHHKHPTVPMVISHHGMDSKSASHGDEDSPVLNTPQTARRMVSPVVIEDDDGYDPDPASDHDQGDESLDDSDDDEDDDGGLQMMGRSGHSRSRGQGSAMFPANALLTTRHRERRGTAGSAFSKKSSRSDSNNTMRRVVSGPGESESPGARSTS